MLLLLLDKVLSFFGEVVFLTQDVSQVLLSFVPVFWQVKSILVEATTKIKLLTPE